MRAACTGPALPRGDISLTACDGRDRGEARPILRRRNMPRLPYANRLIGHKQMLTVL